jgi:glycosyltransferase involved in cell wall biosynthesis
MSYADPIRVGVDLSAAIVGITGVGRYSRTLWERLSRTSEVAPRGFAFGRGGEFRDGNALRIGLPLRVVHALWRVGRLKAETILGEIDVVHSLDMVPPPTSKPLVLTWHESLKHERDFHPKRALQLRKRRLDALSRAAVVVVNSKSSAQDLTDFGYPSERLVIAPPGFELPETSPGFDHEGPFVLAAGALTPRKGFDVLAKAMAKLGPNAPPLLIAGPDGYKADLVKQQIASNIAPARCILLGDMYDSIGALYSQATVVCHPSLDESFGMVCLEAMGAGAAVVAADIPPIREMGDGCVSLVPPGDHEALAEAVQRLLSDDDERRRLGELARARAASYTWDETVRRYVQAYRQAMNS